MHKCFGIYIHYNFDAQPAKLCVFLLKMVTKSRGETEFQRPLIPNCDNQAGSGNLTHIY